MSLDIKIPAVGESITEVTIGRWLKKDGEAVSADEALCELESEKATFELNAESAGVLKILKKEGETVKVGTSIGVIEENGKSVSVKDVKKEVKKETEAAKKKPSKAGKIVEMKVPAVGESITEVTVASWAKKDGDRVVLDEAIAEIESEKATFELTAEAGGILKIVAKAGSTVPIGALLCTIAEVEDAGEKSLPETPKASVAGAAAGTESYAKGHPSPAAAKILDEKNIPPASVTGTGVDGRITRQDALGAAGAAASATITKEPAKSPALPATAGARSRNEKREKLSTLRKTLARRLVSAKNETAMLTTFNEVNMQAMMDLRKKFKDIFKEKFEVNLGFMSFFTKACCIALREWPSVNAMIDGDEVVYHDYCDISIAVSAPRGLVVPVIRNAESMTFAEIEKEVARLAVKARDSKLTLEEMSGGTFTITNGGVFGSMLSTPIINVPQSAILGMHNIVERPVAENGQVVIRPVMFLALSYDHRVIDGRESVSFLVRVKQLLEDPARLMLEI